MKSDYGKFKLDVPRDRNNSFEPQIVKKNHVAKRNSHLQNNYDR